MKRQRRSTLTGLLLILIITACNNEDARQPPPPVAINPYQPYYQMIREGITLLKDGDLVMRNSQDFSSQAIRQFSKTDKSYSHSGIVIMENGYPMIYHVLMGDQNPDEKLRKDSLQVFANPRKVFGYGIYRYQLDSEERLAFCNKIREYYRQEIKFDSLFNMKTDDRMYCSEMIYKALKAATNNRIELASTTPSAADVALFSKHIKIPPAVMASMKVIASDNLYLHPACRLVKKYEFKDTTVVKEPQP